MPGSPTVSSCANLQLPSPCPFLTRDLERTQDTPPRSVRHPLGWVILPTLVLLLWLAWFRGCWFLFGENSS